MKERPKKTTKRGAGKKKRAKAEKKTKPELEPITPEERMALTASMPTWPQLLGRVEQEILGIADEEERAQARERIWRKIKKQIAKWDAEAERSGKGKAIGADHFLLKFRNDSDVAGERLALALQFHEVIDSQQAARGLPVDSFERLTNALLFEVRCFFFSQLVAGQFPDGQRNLAGALMFMLLNYPRGQYMVAVNERGRELTIKERDELKVRCESTLKSLPEIVRKLMPDEFKDCARSIPDPSERLYEEAWKFYRTAYRRRTGLRPARGGKLDGATVREVMRISGVPKTSYRTFYQGLTDERMRWFLAKKKH